jgi:hypothetical protein
LTFYAYVYVYAHINVSINVNVNVKSPASGRNGWNGAGMHKILMLR